MPVVAILACDNNGYPHHHTPACFKPHPAHQPEQEESEELKKIRKMFKELEQKEKHLAAFKEVMKL